MEYEFNRSLYQHVASMFLNKVANTTLDAFTKRVEQLKEIEVANKKELEREKERRQVENSHGRASLIEQEAPKKKESPQNILKKDVPISDVILKKPLEPKKIKLNPISIMMKPRTVKNEALQKQSKLVDELIVKMLYEYKQQGLINEDQFFVLTDRYINDLTVKEVLRNLYTLHRDGIISESVLLFNMKQLSETPR